MTNALSVSKFNNYIKNIFDAEELLHNISVVGEVFGVSISRNIMYFSLRDEGATLSCVCFSPSLFSVIKEGTEIVVTGSPNYYVKGGRFSFVVNKAEESGQGKLFEEFLRLKAQLELEGLFEQSHKKSIPTTIKRIGVITSSEGAVLQDIKNVAWRRNPAVDIVLFSTRVQGKGAELEIAHAIEKMGQYENIDVLIVARGGGSLEDLWAYNTEVVARATYNCPKPIISAVGHETDFTIIDFVSDLRAPTPSAAAELLTINVADKKKGFYSLTKRLVWDYQTYISSAQNKLEDNKTKINSSLHKIVLEINNKFNKTSLKFKRAMERYLEERTFNLGLIDNSLNKLNPSSMLKRGFAKVEQNGLSISNKKEVNFDKDLDIFFKDGVLQATPKRSEK